MKKRVLIIGPKQSGKREIAQYIEQSQTEIRKVANVLYTEKTMIVPDTYLESPWMHKHIIALQQTASCALFLVPIKSSKVSYPPNFSKIFRVPVVGMITSHGKSYTEKDQKQALNVIEKIGLSKTWYQVDLEKETDVEYLINTLKW
ncbi:EutP/PduV family microcompartment system protein [Vagococcus luciliae]|uniref:Ethanolamine utilization protein EutP n=1 Tax=Vagococcus luciliae TaxID=2920380 RepID=A0ABY5NWX9_9ENTE|nr:EutP/PduV family microcompartment system protein [Vagococcus luciliae]UUV98082.1 hypothetical protein G314FT_01730 [Vagococcus luciliae]